MWKREWSLIDQALGIGTGVWIKGCLYTPAMRNKPLSAKVSLSPPQIFAQST